MASLFHIAALTFLSPPSRFKDYIRAKDNGSLVTTHVARVQQRATQAVPHSHRASDAPLQFGDSVMLRNRATGQFLAVDPDSDAEWMTSTAREPAPTARNVFIVIPAPGDEGAVQTGDALTYSTRFCLASEPVLRLDARSGAVLPSWLLQGEAKSYLTMSRLAQEGKVFFGDHASVSANGESTVWTCASNLGGTTGWRFEAQRRPVLPGAGLVLRHSRTNNALTASTRHGYTCKYDFQGREHEVYMEPQKAQNEGGLYADEHTWEFVAAASAEAAQDTRGLVAKDVGGVVAAVAAATDAPGRADVLAEIAGPDGRAEIGALRAGLADLGCALTDEDAALVRDGYGDDARAFLAAVAAVGESKEE